MTVVTNVDTGKILIKKMKRADTFWRRFLGLLPEKSLPADEGLLLTPCRSVHTFFMRFEIDVIYLDNMGRVLAAFSHVKPWRILPFVKGVEEVLETASGTVNRTETKPGNYLNWVDETRSTCHPPGGHGI